MRTITLEEHFVTPLFIAGPGQDIKKQPPLSKDDTVVYSGLAEIALGSALIVSPKAGKVAAGFLAAVFPGNVSQYTHHRSAFGLDTDQKRLARLFFQPLLIFWALKSTSK